MQPRHPWSKGLRFRVASIAISLALLGAQVARAEIEETNARFLRYLRRDSPLTAIERTLGITRSNATGSRPLGLERRSTAQLYGVRANATWRGLLGRLFTGSEGRLYGVGAARSITRLSGIVRRSPPTQLYGIRGGDPFGSGFLRLAFGQRVERSVIGYPKLGATRVNRWFESNILNPSRLLGPKPWRNGNVLRTGVKLHTERTNGVKRSRPSGGKLYGVTARSPSAILSRGIHGKKVRRLNRRAFGL